MYTNDHTQLRAFPSVIDSLHRFSEAGIDPAYDAEYEELEREFAEIRLTFGNY